LNKRANSLLALIAAIVGGLLLFSPPLRAADPLPLPCPNGQTVFLEGQAAPREALLVFLRGRAVGGGLSGGDGRFRLPLRPQERPGVYPVEVRLRSSRAMVAAYTCFIDVSPEGALTPTATIGASTAPPIGRVTPTAPTARVAPTTGAATPTSTVTPTTASGGGGSNPVATNTSVVTVSPTATISTTATVTTTTTTVPANSVEINDIVLRDPAFPNESEEYVQIRNAGETPVNLAGWRLLNATRPGQVPAYTFPSFSLGVDVTIAVFSAVGEDELDVGDFYWDQTVTIWQVGDRAELRDAQNNLIASLVVPNQ
jgi:hypothetical protein